MNSFTCGPLSFILLEGDVFIVMLDCVPIHRATCRFSDHKKFLLNHTLFKEPLSRPPGAVAYQDAGIQSQFMKVSSSIFCISSLDFYSRPGSKSPYCMAFLWKWLYVHHHFLGTAECFEKWACFHVQTRNVLVFLLKLHTIFLPAVLNFKILLGHKNKCMVSYLPSILYHFLYYFNRNIFH